MNDPEPLDPEEAKEMFENGSTEEPAEKKSESSPYSFSLGFRTVGVFFLSNIGITIFGGILWGTMDVHMEHSNHAGDCFKGSFAAICAIFYYFYHKFSDE